MGEAKDPSADEAVRRLEQRLDRASEAAERLIAEAAAAALHTPPPSGWQAREPEDDAPHGFESGDSAKAAPSEIELLLEAVRALRDRIPPDLLKRVAEAVREVLLALRALIEWYLERTQKRRPEAAEVRDIPII